jgi:raffinose/stachyose/melibiose transport system permease protein
VADPVLTASEAPSVGRVAASAPRRVPLRRFRRRAPSEPSPLIGYAYIAPALLVYVAFTLAPFLHAVWLSFFAWDGITPGHYIGLANYRTILGDSTLRQIFWHPLVLIAFYSLLPIAIGLAITALMMRIRVHGLAAFRAVLFLPQVIATVSVALAWLEIYALNGPLNEVLRAVGLGFLARAWLGDYTWALPALGLIGTWFTFGFCMVLFIAGAQKISRSLYDAAKVDGAGAWAEFRAVTLPGLRRELVFALVLTIINALRTFDINYLLTQGGPGLATDVPSYEVYRQAFFLGNVGQAAAVGVVLTAIIMAVIYPITRLDRTND